MPPSYDPALNVLYIGTSVTSPAPKFLLGGVDKQHLYHNSTLAIDATRASSGGITSTWSITGTSIIPLSVCWLIPRWLRPERGHVDNPRIVSGERRAVITGIPGKTGIIYTLDRKTGEFLWARATNFQNVVRSIDGATGAAVVNPDALFTRPTTSVSSAPRPTEGKTGRRARTAL